MIYEGDVESTVSSLLSPDTLPYPKQPEPTHTGILSYLWQQGNHLLPEELRQQEIYFRLRKYEANKTEFSCFLSPFVPDLGKIWDCEGFTGLFLNGIFF